MGNAQIRSYRDFRIWQEAMVLAERCYVLTRTYPKDELFGLVCQMLAQCDELGRMLHALISALDRKP